MDTATTTATATNNATHLRGQVQLVEQHPVPLLQRPEERPVLPRKGGAISAAVLPLPGPRAVGREVRAKEVRDVRLLAQVHAREPVPRRAGERLDQGGLSHACVFAL